MELELERSQHHLRQSVFAQWNLGLWNSEPGTHIQSHLQLDRIVSLFLRPALLLRNDRHGHVGQSIAYTNASALPHACADGATYAHISTDTSSISHPDRNAYANIYTHAYANIYTRTYAHIYTHTSSISYPDRNAYANVYTRAHADIY